MRYVSAQEAAAIDALLLGDTYRFSLDQLMELAGLACAQAMLECYPPDHFTSALVMCGPGNQGGDGLVAARHLHQFGYKVQVWCPRRKQGELFDRLQTQLKALNVPFVSTGDLGDAYEQCDVVLDCIFGFSFSGEARGPYKDALEMLKNKSHNELELRRKSPPIVSIDLPSGWDVNKGNIHNTFTPEVLLSLTVPKLGALHFPHTHFLGGRFVPDELERTWNLSIPMFTGASQIVDITGAKPVEDNELSTSPAARESNCFSSS